MVQNYYCSGKYFSLGHFIVQTLKTQLMNKGQRKTHIIIWMVLAVCIPVGFISAIMVIPDKPMQEDVFLKNETVLEEISKEIVKDNLIVLIRNDKAKTSYQLQLLVSTPFKQADIGIYYSLRNKFDPLQSIYLGNLPPKGGKVFSLPSDEEFSDRIHIVLFDPIKNELINQIQIEL